MDPFHSIIDLPTKRLISFMVLAYVSSYFVFACLYYYVVEGLQECNLGFKDGFMDAMFLS